MSKQQFKVEDFGHVTPGLISRIESVIADRKFGRLSSGAIYKAHNELFKLREPQQTCTSCLIVRGDKLAKWYEWQAKTAAPKEPAAVQLPVTNVGTGDEPDPAAPQVTYDLEDGRVLTLHADGVVKIGDDVVTEGAFNTKDGVALAVFEGQVVSNPEGAAVPVTGGAPDSMPAAQTEKEAPQIILQKINKDDYAKTEGEAFFGVFTPSAEDATKGQVVNAETGKSLAAGTYATADTKQVLTVQPGGKAAYKAV